LKFVLVFRHVTFELWS